MKVLLSFIQSFEEKDNNHASLFNAKWYKKNGAYVSSQPPLEKH